MTGSPADKAGLQPGDIVLKFAGNTIRTANQLRNAVAATAPDTNTELVVLREGQTEPDYNLRPALRGKPKPRPMAVVDY